METCSVKWICLVRSPGLSKKQISTQNIFHISLKASIFYLKKTFLIRSGKNKQRTNVIITEKSNFPNKKVLVIAQKKLKRFILDVF